jgi:hypothetical protein
MQDNIIKIDELLTKFYLKEPASADVQRHIRKIKRSQFKKILKRAGAYSIVFGAIAGVYFSLKKLGIVISIYKSVIVVIAASTLAATGVTFGTYRIYKHVFVPEINKPVDIIWTSIPMDMEIPKEKDTIQRKENVSKNIDVKKIIGIQAFSAEGVEAGLSRKAFNKIYSELGRLRGSNYIKDISKPDAENAGMALKGSVELLDGIYNVSVKIINVKNLNILYYNSVKANKVEEIDSACIKLSKEIADAFPVKGK